MMQNPLVQPRIQSVLDKCAVVHVTELEAGMSD